MWIKKEEMEKLLDLMQKLNDEIKVSHERELRLCKTLMDLSQRITTIDGKLFPVSEEGLQEAIHSLEEMRKPL